MSHSTDVLFVFVFFGRYCTNARVSLSVYSSSVFKFASRFLVCGSILLTISWPCFIFLELHMKGSFYANVILCCNHIVTFVSKTEYHST